MTTPKRGTRARLLTGAGTAVLATVLVSGAHAADTTIDLSGVSNISATAGLAINSPQANNGAVSARIEGATGTVNQSGSEENTTNNTSVSTEDNAIAAKAIGNSNVSSIPALAEIGPNGAAILNASINAAGDLDADPTATGVVTSSVTNSVITNQLVDFETGAVTTSGNTISADTTLNSGSSSISGTVPLGFSSATAGSSTLEYSGAGDQFNATGTLVASSVQQAIGTGQGAGSNASVVDNEISIGLTSSADNTVSAAPVVDDNAIAATFKGNSARNTVDIQQGGNPSFAGSAAVSNLQVNAGDAPTDVDTTPAAYNSGSRIGVEIFSEEDTNSLEGTVLVTGNSISSAATGNEALGSTAGTAGNRIILGDGMAILGAGTPAAGASITYTGGGVDSTVAADLVINNSQGNVAAGETANRLVSVTTGAEIGADIQALDGSQSTVSGNSVTATTTGNAASSAIATGANTGAFSASVAVANQQTNDGVAVAARNTNSNIGTFVGFGDDLTNDTSLSVTSNTSAATAYGNQVSQQVQIDANSIALSAGTVGLSSGTGPDGRVSADGAATVSNLQSRYSGPVLATNEGSTIGASALADDETNRSSLAVTSNRQEAVAVGASASNGLSLASGTALGSGAGIANVQIGSATSPVTATLDESYAWAYVAEDLANGTVSSTNNLQRAIAYGNSAGNALDASGTTTTPALAGATEVASAVSFDQDASGGLVFNNTPSTAPTVNAAFGLLNDQSIQGNVQATASDALLEVAIEDGVDDSTVANDGNTLVAAAYGNDGANGITLAPGALTTGVDGGFASVANVTNVQTVGGNAAITAEASGGNVVLTSADDVTDSSVSTSGNAIQALAVGNRASGNQVVVSATTLSTIPDGDDVRGSATHTAGDQIALVTDAAFSVQNAQSGLGSVTATQLAGGDAAQVRVSVDDVSNSSIAADANVSSASATSNSAVNSLFLDANSLATTGAVQNFQTTNADVSALIGEKGVRGAPATPYPGVGVTGGAVLGGGDVVLSLSGVLTVSGDAVVTLTWSSDLTPEAETALNAYLTALGFAVDTAANTATAGEGAYDMSSFDARSLTGTDLSFTGFNADGVIGSPNQGGVTVAVGSDVVDSTLSVANNATRGSVVGNNASNSLTATGAQIANGSNSTVSSAGVLGLDDDDNSVVGAAADHSLVNFQSVESDNLTSDVAGAFAISADADAVVSNSTLSVSGNSQSATAVANTAGNGLTVGDANTANLSAGSALLSMQSGDAAVSATSDAELFAPGAVSNSTVALSDNINSSLAVINDVTNTVSVAAANIAPVDGPANVNLSGGIVTGTAVGDHVLANRQDATTSVSSTATTQLYNQDEIASATSGLANSSLSVTGNTTAAEASANRALNTLNVAGGASNGANAGIGNFQYSDAGVSAQANTSATVRLAGGLDGDDEPIAALNGSSASISGNATTALARGNSASNVLNATAGANYGGSVGAASVSGGTVQATAGVLNNQANYGGVRADSVSVSYQVALNGAGTGPAISNGSVAVSGNQVAAEAYGNSATNRVTLTALNTSAPSAAVGNYQLNAGAITATATSVTFGVTGVGAATGSMLRTAGNQVTATAVGNSAVTSISAAR